MPAMQIAATTRFTFAPGAHGPGVDAWTGMVKHFDNGDVGLCREGHDEIEVWIHERRLIAD